MTYRLAGAAALPGFDRDFLGQLELGLRAALPDSAFVRVLGLGLAAGPGARPLEAELKALLAGCGLAALLLPPSSPRECGAVTGPDAGRGVAGLACGGFAGHAGLAGNAGNAGLVVQAGLASDGSVAYRDVRLADDPGALARGLAEAAEPWPALPGPLARNAACLPSWPVVLVGPMASGKTTLGTLIARRTGADFVDLDALVEAEAGLSVSRIFEAEGEAGFRLRESEALEEAVDKACRRGASAGTVIATGGGAVLAERNRTLLAGRARVVWLHAEAAVLAARAAADEASPGQRRPLLSGVDPLARLSALQRERLPFYASVASFLLPAGGRKADILAEVLHDALF